MLRLLLLVPTTTYRTEDFVEAARKLDVDLVVASERPNVFSERLPDTLLTLDFTDPETAAREMVAFARRTPFNAVVPVDDRTTVVGAAIANTLGLPSNTVAAVSATRNKYQMREALAKAGVPSPPYTLFTLADKPAVAARKVPYPCVLKPTILAASRGVIRADNEGEFVAAFRRIEAILKTPEVTALGAGADQILVEGFIAGREVALEGLLLKGTLQVLALFDKPDPLDGPFFEETIYVTPSRLPAGTQAAIADFTAWAARALGLREGPIHAELRVDETGPWVVEIAARSIGGLCSRTLRFGTGLTLEELILRHALGIEIETLERAPGPSGGGPEPAGVMMIPIPGAGILEEIRGQEAVKAVPGIEEITMTTHLGQELVPLPEGSRYLGFIFARAETPEAVEAALREAHRRLEFVIAPAKETGGGEPGAG
ncbi:MAG: ATP-grasp domain-containing protein [Candidatus Rokubacteria bacterium]|nr:ATP-grasp domain-containing protein [Candidatus Rokubacteria bacterium]